MDTVICKCLPAVDCVLVELYFYVINFRIFFYPFVWKTEGSRKLNIAIHGHTEKASRICNLYISYAQNLPQRSLYLDGKIHFTLFSPTFHLSQQPANKQQKNNTRRMFG